MRNERIRNRFCRWAGVCFCLLVCAFLLISCSSENPRSEGRFRKKQWRKITGHKLQLSIITTRGDYYREEGIPTIRFALKNTGPNPVAVREWKARPVDNIRLYYAYCPPGTGAKDLKEQDWIQAVRPGADDAVYRYPIELGPTNAVIVDMPMTFFPSLKKSGLYAIRGELDLQSLDLKSLPVEIRIR